MNGVKGLGNNKSPIVACLLDRLRRCIKGYMGKKKYLSDDVIYRSTPIILFMPHFDTDRKACSPAERLDRLSDKRTVA